MQELTIDEEFYFQWHLTERCNRACRHCYQDGSPTSELGLNDLLTIVDLMEGATAKTNDSVCGTGSFATKWCQAFQKFLVNWEQHLRLR